MLCGDLHEFLLHACLPFVSACPSPPCYYSFARRGRASGWWRRRWICLLCSAPPPWPPRWRAPASCSFRALLFRFVPFLRGSFPPSPSWSPPPGTPRGTPARSKRRDRDARGRWFAFPFRSSLPAVHDDREQSAAKTDGRVSPPPPRTRPRDRRNITLGPSARDQRTGRVDRYRHCAGWRRGPSGRDVTVAAARARRRPSFVSGAGRAAFSFGKFVDFYLYCI